MASKSTMPKKLKIYLSLLSATRMRSKYSKVKVSDVVRLLLGFDLERYEVGKLKPDLRPTGYTLFTDKVFCGRMVETNPRRW